MTHTSGLTVDGRDFWKFWDAHVGKTTTTQFAKSLVTLPRNPPGEKFAYGQTGAAYEVLAAVIENASGKTFEVFMRENIFDPLTLVDSSYYVPATQSGRLPAVYRRVDGILQLDRKQGEDFSRSTFFHGVSGKVGAVQRLDVVDLAIGLVCKVDLATDALPRYCGIAATKFSRVRPTSTSMCCLNRLTSVSV